MGQPVVHFEVIGNDSEKLRSYYSDLFGWQFDADNPMNYGVVQRDDNIRADGVGIGGGVGRRRRVMTATSPSMSRCPTSKPRSRRPRASAARGCMGPDKVMDGSEIGQFQDPEGTHDRRPQGHSADLG